MLAFLARNRAWPLATLLLALALAVTIALAPGARADASGNYPMAQQFYSCGPNYAGWIKYAYTHTHEASLQEKVYGVYGAKSAGTGWIISVDSYQSPPSPIAWTHIDTSFPPVSGSWGYLVDGPAPSVSTGRAKWVVDIGNPNGTVNTCVIGGDGSLLFGRP